MDLPHHWLFHKAGRCFLIFCLVLTMAVPGSMPVSADSKIASEYAKDSDDRECAEKMARIIWNTGKSRGMSPEAIAAVLGGLTEWTGLDPSAVEMITGETMNPEGERKTAALEDLNAYTENVIIGLLRAMNELHPEEPYKGTDGLYPGLGIGRWRGLRAQEFLEAADYMVDGQWYLPEFNAVFLLGSPAPTGSTVFGKVLGEWSGKNLTLEEAVTLFCTQWMGLEPDAELDSYVQAARSWMVRFSAWEYDSGEASEMELLIKRLDHHRVIREFTYDNSTLELAMVSISYPVEGMGLNNNGTELYRTVRDNIGDFGVIYQSCDRGVGTAVRWSGTDDDFPMGNVITQYNYMKNSDQWELIAVGSEISRDNLKPGDIFVVVGNVGHIWMYVGQEAIRAIYGENFFPAGADCASAAYMKWSPMLGQDFGFCIETLGGYAENIDTETGTWFNPPQYVPYYQFRLVYSDDSDLYRGAADGDPLRWPR